MKRIISYILSFALLCSACSCLWACADLSADTNNRETETMIDTHTENPNNKKISGNSSNLTNGFTASNISVREVNNNDRSHYYSFTTKLFATTHKDGKNTLVSPLSVFVALAMLSNGADGNTLKELEDTLGMSKDELNVFVKSYMSTLPETDYSKLKIANSVWFRDAKWFKANESFLQTNADYFGADIYKSPFDKASVNDINTWVNDKTDEMIPEIIDEISPETVMFLINALSFDAEWAEKYDEYSVRDGEFKSCDGKLQDVEFMYSDEGYLIKDDNSIGFIKYYKGMDYAFVAILPDEQVNVDEYIETLDKDKIFGLLKSKTSTKVSTCMPKFKVDFKCELTDTLKEMGINDAFNSGSANLSRLGESALGNLFVSSVLHKTFIEVNESGTKAGAVTSIAVETECAASDSVILNRPFVYMIVDAENDLPLFIGNVSSIT